MLKCERIFPVLVSLLLCTVLAGPSDEPGLAKLSEHVYAAAGFKNPTIRRSFGVNSGVIVGDDAVLVIDTRISAKKAQELIVDIRQVTDKPIKYVVNTHFHLDHTWGNCEFVRQGAVVIGHENLRLTAAKTRNDIKNATNFGLTAEDMEGTVASIATITFKDTMHIDLGGVTARLTYMGHTHTNDGIVALIEPDGVLFTGDILFVGYHPSMTYADITGWLKALEELKTTEAKIVVPGHGPVSTVRDINDMVVYLAEFDRLARQLCEGKPGPMRPKLQVSFCKSCPSREEASLKQQ
jgi:glyoxylase-like metal-dependent hydrolase (beta-lactamase superfamily II)